MKILRNKRGFTLIEVSITLAILAIIMTAMIWISLSGGRIYDNVSSRATLNDTANLIFQKVTTEIESSEYMKIYGGITTLTQFNNWPDKKLDKSYILFDEDSDTIYVSVVNTAGGYSELVPIIDSGLMYNAEFDMNFIRLSGSSNTIDIKINPKQAQNNETDARDYSLSMYLHNVDTIYGDASGKLIEYVRTR